MCALALDKLELSPPLSGVKQFFIMYVKYIQLEYFSIVKIILVYEFITIIIFIYFNY